MRLARSFGLDVVAEGVETVELVHELLGLGCFRAQGYLLSRPKPPADLTAILRRGGIDMAALTRPQEGQSVTGTAEAGVMAPLEVPAVVPATS